MSSLWNFLEREWLYTGYFHALFKRIIIVITSNSSFLKVMNLIAIRKRNYPGLSLEQGGWEETGDQGIKGGGSLHVQEVSKE